jgi:hypothetical protein
MGYAACAVFRAQGTIASSGALVAGGGEMFIICLAQW